MVLYMILHWDIWCFAHLKSRSCSLFIISLQWSHVVGFQTGICVVADLDDSFHKWNLTQVQVEGGDFDVIYSFLRQFRGSGCALHVTQRDRGGVWINSGWGRLTGSCNPLGDHTPAHTQTQTTYHCEPVSLDPIVVLTKHMLECSPVCP